MPHSCPCWVLRRCALGMKPRTGVESAFLPIKLSNKVFWNIKRKHSRFCAKGAMFNPPKCQRGWTFATDTPADAQHFSGETTGAQTHITFRETVEPECPRAASVPVEGKDGLEHACVHAKVEDLSLWEALGSVLQTPEPFCGPVVGLHLWQGQPSEEPSAAPEFQIVWRNT